MTARIRAAAASLLVTFVGVGIFVVFMQRYRSEASGGTPHSVMTITRDIPPGTVITEEMVGVRALPEAYLESRHIEGSEAQSVLGLRTTTALRSGQSLLWTDLDTGGEQGIDLSGLVGSGMRAVTIEVRPQSAFDGLLRPGDRVDVVHHGERAGSAERVSVSLLQSMLVLAVSGSIGRAGDEEQTTRSCGQTHVTLAATMEQSQAILHAQGSGELSLVLRHPDDIALLEGLPETTDADILEPARRERIRRSADEPQVVAATTTPETTESRPQIVRIQ